MQDTKPTQSFASHSHTSSIRCVTRRDKLIASGGADDRIIIYDMKSRKELYTLDHHNGTVNCLEFTENNSHLISGGADGVLAIVRVGSWMLEKVWEKAHKGTPITDIAIHPSGKLALTLGGDCTLKTWNLIKGRKAFAVNLNSKSSDAKSLSTINWAPDGVNFVLAGGKFTEIWSINTGGIVTSIEHEQKVACCIWIDDKSLVVGYENGKIATVDIKSQEINIFEAHESRVKTITKHENYFITACSNGEVKIWNKEFDEIIKFDTGCRITCSTVLPLKKPKEELEEITSNKSAKRLLKSANVDKVKKKKRKSSSNWIVEDIS